jgi:hypothetical protein
MSENTVLITETNNKVIVSTPGPQGIGGRTILNGNGAPANNLGVAGDFYYDKVSTYFYGPKVVDFSWAGASSYPLQQLPAEFSFEVSWELAQVSGPVNGVYSLVINHNLGFKPNVTVKTSAGDVLETGIDYNSNNQLTLTMAQPFSGTAYLS